MFTRHFLKTIHPLTHILLALEISALLLLASPFHGTYLVLMMFAIAALLKKRSDTDIMKPCMRVLGVAVVFLFLIHGLSYRELALNDNFFDIALPSFVRIAVPVSAALYLSKMIRAEEIFALCIDLRLPQSLVLILFRTIWLVPRLMERMDEVVTAQKLRGVRISTPYQRLKAILPTLSAIFSSMVEETSENALVLTVRGFLSKGPKSHISVLQFGMLDVLILLSSTILMVLI